MGTNFYFVQNHCECCKREEKLHIGKRSGGWEFHFAAYEQENPEWTSREVIPVGGVAIKSRKDWEKYLDARPTNGWIEDEYGTRFSPDEFWKEVDDTRLPWGKDNKPPINHVEYLKTDKYWKDYPGVNAFLDADGWSFSLGEFS